MTYPATLQAYYDTHDTMIDGMRAYEKNENNPIERVMAAQSYGLYKFARAAAVREGLLPETPQFDAESKG